VLGSDIYEIGAKLNLSPETVLAELEAHHQERQSWPTETRSFYRALSLSRCEKLLSVYLPLALRLEEGSGEEQINYALHTVAFALATIRFQAELLGLKTLDTDELNSGTSHKQCVSLIHAQLEYIDKMVREAPRDTLSLSADSVETAPEPTAEPDTVHPAAPEDEFLFDLDQIDNIEPSPAAPAEPPLQLEAERRRESRESARERFFRGECDAL
jgi:hypothetical protein